MQRLAEMNMLGGFRLAVDGGAIRLPQQAQRVLVLVAVRRTVLNRTAVAAVLWGHLPDRRAQANLRNALWRIQLATDAVLHCTRDTVGLDDGVVLDLERAARTAHDLLAGVVGAGGPPVDLLCGDLLPDWDEDWLIIEREQHRQLRLHALEALSAALRLAGRWPEAIAAALAAVQAEPLRESAQRVLIEAHVGEGNLIEAVRQRDTYRQLLAGELGIPPSRRLEALVDAALRVPSG